MPKSKSTDAILTEAEQIARVWAANSTFSLGDLPLAQFKAKITDLRTKRDPTQQLRTLLTALVNDTNAGGDAVASVITHACSSFSAVFGPDSTQYEQAGGTRPSDRKRTTRKPKPDDSKWACPHHTRRQQSLPQGGQSPPLRGAFRGRSKLPRMSRPILRAAEIVARLL